MFWKNAFATLLPAAGLCLGSTLSVFAPASANEGEAGPGIAPTGTYFLTERQVGIATPYTRLLTLFADGNMTGVQALQYGLGILDNRSFSSEHGAWRRTGDREVTVKALGLNYRRSDGVPLFNCLSTIVLRFDPGSPHVTGTKQGQCYEPVSVDPFAPGDIKPSFEFTGSFEGRRIGVH